MSDINRIIILFNGEKEFEVVVVINFKSHDLKNEWNVKTIYCTNRWVYPSSRKTFFWLGKNCEVKKV